MIETVGVTENGNVHLLLFLVECLQFTTGNLRPLALALKLVASRLEAGVQKGEKRFESNCKQLRAA